MSILVSLSAAIGVEIVIISENSAPEMISNVTFAKRLAFFLKKAL
jgi:hypothetical protein